MLHKFFIGLTNERLHLEFKRRFKAFFLLIAQFPLVGRLHEELPAERTD